HVHGVVPEYAHLSKNGVHPERNGVERTSVSIHLKEDLVPDADTEQPRGHFGDQCTARLAHPVRFPRHELEPSDRGPFGGPVHAYDPANLHRLAVRKHDPERTEAGSMGNCRWADSFPENCPQDETVLIRG